MTREKGQKFSAKHDPDARMDPTIAKKINKHMVHGELACAVAFKIAEELAVPPAEVGKTLDLLDLKLSKCQLGLFGYVPAKKKVTARAPDNPRMEETIHDKLVDGKLACRDAWDIAIQYKVPKMAVSGACESLGIKIKPCQLGAF